MGAKLVTLGPYVAWALAVDLSFRDTNVPSSEATFETILFWLMIVVVPLCLGGFANVITYVVLRRKTLKMLQDALHDERAEPRTASFSVAFGSEDVHFVWAGQAEERRTAESEIRALERANTEPLSRTVWFLSSFSRQSPAQPPVRRSQSVDERKRMAKDLLLRALD